jgi:dCMP deaminase
MNSWDIRFLRLAKEISTWSKDPSTRVGAVITNERNQILSLGFNGFPRGVNDDDRLHDRTTKLQMVVHAEANALLNASCSLRDSTAYIYPFMPCSNCAGLLIQAGVKRVVSVVNDNPRWQESFNLTRKMFAETEIELVLYDADSIRDLIQISA